MSAFGQLGLLLWKNLLIQRRSPVWTIFEIFIPLLLSCLLLLPAILRKEDGPIGYRTYFRPTNPTKIVGNGQDIENMIRNTHENMCMNASILYYTPNSTFYTNVMQNVVNRFSPRKMDAIGFESEKTMDEAFEESFGDCIEYQFCGGHFSGDDGIYRDHPPCKSAKIWGGIVFSGVENKKHLKYKIRVPNQDRRGGRYWYSGFRTGLRYSPAEYWTTSALEFYKFTGFVTLQRAVDIGWMEAVADDNETFNKVADIGIDLTPQLWVTWELSTQMILVMLILYYAFMMALIFTIRNVVHEKEQGLKEYMKVMGLQNWVQWLAHFISSLLKLSVFCLALTIILCIEINEMAIFPNSDPTLVFVFLMFLSAGIIMFAFAVSVFFSSTTPAVAVGGILYFILSAASLLIVSNVLVQDSYTPWPKSLHLYTMFVYNMAMARGFFLIAAMEKRGVGIQWRYIGKPINHDERYAMLMVLIMLFLDMMICFLLSWYVDAVNPGKEGVPQKPWFPFMPSYWCPGMDKDAEKWRRRSKKRAEKSTAKRGFVEPVPEGSTPAIDIDGLVKYFTSGKTLAVDGLYLQMYPDQITAFLGHNGAGKTTTMNILTGILPPSAGDVRIKGLDLRGQLDEIRTKLGLCPQHNILFDMLTVNEHLKLFCKLKGKPIDENEITHMLGILTMTDKRHAQAKTLSGGMKRKLLVMIALIGHSEVVFLDEPTSGMDPSARHSMWEFLKAEKGSRTIILTTHYMEEADVLGDRIAILAKGQLQCCGSSLFLKKHYGAGYNLTVNSSSEPKVAEILGLIREHCPDASNQSVLGTESSYILPEQYQQKFGELFTELESKQSELGIQSFGVSITTMDDVFIKVGQIAEAELQEEDEADGNVKTDDSSALLNNLEETLGVKTPIEGPRRWLHQYKALLIKKAHLARHYLLLLIPHVLLPVIFAVLCVVLYHMEAIITSLAESEGPVEAVPTMPLGLSRFRWAKVPILDIGPSNVQGNISMSFEKYIESQPKLSAETVPQSFVTDKNRTIQFHGYPDTELYHIMTPMNRYIFTKYLDDPGHAFTTDRDYIISATFQEDEDPVATYNTMLYHGPAIAINLVDNALANYVLGSGSQIEASNQPLGEEIWKAENRTVTRPTSNQRDYEMAMMMAIAITNTLMFAMAFVVSSFIILIVIEQSTSAKHLQLLTGVHTLIYWLATITWDVITYFIAAVLIIVIFAIGDVRVFIINGAWIWTLLVLLLFGISSLLRVYLISFIFKGPGKAFIISVILGVIVEMQAIPIFQFVLQPPVLSLATAGLLEFLFGLASPSFAFALIMDVIPRHAMAPEMGREDVPSILSWQGGEIRIFTRYGAGKFFFFFMLQIALYTALIIFAELGWVGKCCAGFKEWICRRKANSTAIQMQSTVPSDDDVVTESELVPTLTSGSHPLIVNSLCKNFGYLPAVNNLSFGTSERECFGLLGINGAGKTTTFEMLVGNHTITAGKATICGFDVASGWRKAGNHLGYCPQFDALIERMTGEELLCLFARLRGIPEPDVSRIVQATIKAVGIQQHAKKASGTYSGGNKRRLSLAMSVIGVPKLLLLDEPTAGIDPEARRAVWDILDRLRNQGVALILTSHSMEECDALCTRIGIMVRGQLRCIGSAQHLKTKYGTGYSLQLKVATSENIAPAKEGVFQHFPDSILKESHDTTLIYELPQREGVKWSNMFTKLSGLVEPLNIVHYSLTQTTLEQVFLRFSREALMMTQTQTGTATTTV